jgi:precorrin-6A/cobalt-precorrin-6A reductase
MPDKVLVLGGTTEGAAEARRLVGQGAQVVTSLAGRLREVPPLSGAVRVGGFGGVDGLVDYLRRERFDRVVDATHPFAVTISAHAAQACARLGLPLERCRRPAWRRRPGDRWHWADDMAMAVRMTAKLGRRVLLTVGAGEVAAFARAGGPSYVVRLIEAPGRLPLRDYCVVLGRGPFAVAEERALMRTFAVDLLVTKASGGSATEAKIIAARQLGIPVILVRRPEPA